LPKYARYNNKEEIIMGKGIVINAERVKSFNVDDTYTSRMLLDDTVAGTKTIQINEGTLKKGCETPGAVHKAHEIYFVVKGEAVLHLSDEKHVIKSGYVVFIPAGTFHSLDNSKGAEDFVLLTLWTETEENDVYNLRVKKWGKSFVTIDG
jgi:quercetin dioxygenase-like cupin family protein